MKTLDPTSVGILLGRIGRVLMAGEWRDDLNPAQHNALIYLSQANLFSRAPSNVADYLCTTRGTASQTLKALERKGLIEQSRETGDKRSIRFDLTSAGRAVLSREEAAAPALETLSPAESADLSRLLTRTLHELLAQRGYKTFGVCRTCRYFEGRPQGGHCALLDVALSEKATGQICHEHAAA